MPTIRTRAFGKVSITMFSPLKETKIYAQFENLIPEASIGDFSGYPVMEN
jgi:hypothetical protein